MRRLACLLLVALAPAGASAQSVVSFSEPVIGPDRSLPSACVEHGDERVCRVTVAVGDDVAGAVVVTRAGRETARWAAPVPGLFQDVRVFRTSRGLVVAVLDAIANGLGVASWTVHVVLDGERAPAYSFSVDEFGRSGGSFATSGRRTALWVTEWTDMPDPAGRRKRGLYLVGRPYTLEAEGLVPANELPIRARRLLAGFERAFVEGRGEVRDWLADRRAETLRVDPALVGRAQTTRGQATSAAWDASGFDEALVVTIRTDDGRTVTVRSDAPAFTHVGADATGRLWPAGYRPADASAWLVGRRVRLEARTNEYSTYGVLWRE